MNVRALDGAGYGAISNAGTGNNLGQIMLSVGKAPATLRQSRHLHEIR